MNNTKENLIEGAWYWVIPTLDPDCEDQPWMNDWQVARYAGKGYWNCAGIDEPTDWPMKAIGDQVVPTVEMSQRGNN